MSQDLGEKQKEFIEKNTARLSDYMTPEEIEESYCNMGIINARATEVQTKMEELKRYDTAYNGEQEVKAGRPNTRINIVHPNIEGQVATICLEKIGFSFQGQEYTDQQFAEWARINTEWTLEHQDDMNNTLATFSRRMLKYGWGIFKLSFDTARFGGFGLSVIETPSVDRIFVDSKIKCAADLQKAEYIAEIISASRKMAKTVYGKEKAEQISYGITKLLPGIDQIFDTTEYLVDDATAWCMIQFWTIDEGYLRCREYDSSGLLLWDSFKEGNRKADQSNFEASPKELYKNVYNKYPYIWKNCYEKEGELFGFGDIKLIENLQDMLNTTYDNIRMAIKPNRLLIRASSSILPEDLDIDSFEPLVYDDSAMINGNSGKPVDEVIMGTPSPEWWRMIASIYEAIQRVLRYSELMMGQGTASNTATESAIQERQGSKATSMKQKQLESAIKDAAMYCLGLDLQYKKGKKALRLQTDENTMEWVDYDLMKNIPATVPMESGERKKWLDAGYKTSQIPDTQIGVNKDGKEIKRSIALDLKVKIGSKMEQTPAMEAQMMNQLAALQLMSTDGKMRPAIFWEEYRKYITEANELPLEDAEKVKQSLAKYEEMQAKKQQLELQQAQAQIEQVKSEGTSALPNGTPKSIRPEDTRKQAGVMQGIADFQNLQ